MYIIAHLREQSQFVRVLGSFPKGGNTGSKSTDCLVGPIRNQLNILNKIPVTTEYPSVAISINNIERRQETNSLKIGEK